MDSRLFSKLFIFIFIFFISSLSFAQEDDIFWFAAPDVTDGHGDEPIYLRIANANSLKNTDVTISQPMLNTMGLGVDTTVHLGPNGFASVNLTPYKNFLENSDYNKVVKKGLKVESSKTDITAYYSENNEWNLDLFSLKGKNGFGKHFFVPFQNQMSNDTTASDGFTPPPRSSINMVLTGDESKTTEIWVYPTNPIAGHAGKDSFKVVLENPGETYSLRAKYHSGDMHLGGTEIKVKSGNDIAITIADDSDRRNGVTCRDLNGDQITPVEVVGYDYVVIGGSLTGMGDGDDIYVVATENGTNIDMNGDGTNEYTNLDAGEVRYYDLNSNTTTFISATKPIYVYHITGLNNCEIGGAQIPTVDGCTGSAEVSFYRSNPEPLIVNILAKEEYKNDFWIKYNATDSVKIDASLFSQVPNKPGWIYLSEQADLTESSDPTNIGIPPDSVTTVENHHPQGVFHLGLVNTTSAWGNHGSKYGYFSSFIQDTASAEIATTNSQISKYYCEGDTVYLKASGGRTENSYYWYAEDPSHEKYMTTRNFKTCEVVGLPPDSSYYVFKVVVYPPCQPIDTITMKVRVNSLPKANFEIIDSTSGLPVSNVQCAPYNAYINNKTTDAKRYIWYWDYEDYPRSNYDTIPDMQFRHEFRNPTYEDSVYTVRLLAQGEVCTDEHISEVMVHPEVNANFTVDMDSICNDSDVYFTNTSSGDTSYFDWSFGDGTGSYDTTAINHLHNYNHAYPYDTTFSSQLVATSPANCTDTAFQDIFVESYVEADFPLDTVKGCSPFPIRLNNNSKGDVDTAYWRFSGSQGWTSLDTTYNKNVAPDTTLINTGTRQVDTVDIQLLVSNGNCYDTAHRTVYVYPEVTSDFSPGDSLGCNPMQVEFRNHSAFSGISDTTGLSYSWNFGDGGASNEYEPSHLFDNINPSDTVYTVDLTVTSTHGCWDTTSSDLTVSPYIDADFKVDEGSGCSQHTVIITNAAKGGITSYEWNFGDGSPIRTASKDTLMHTYANTSTSPNTYTLQLVVENKGCTDTMRRDIDVYPSVNADFSMSNPTGCNPSTVDFTNNSAYISTTDTTGLSYSWDFGDGSSSKEFEPSHTFSNYTPVIAEYPVELAVTAPNTCTDTVVDTVRVLPYVEADFTVARADSCSPFTVRIENHSSGGYYEWFWVRTMWSTLR